MTTNYTAAMQLCDNDGTVRSGALHQGTDYVCTGSGHAFGAHILCTQPHHGDTLKQRPGDQPLPTPNDQPDVQSMVIADITARREVGIQRYRTALQPFNGRDALRDAYEEAVDLACYLRQVIAERDIEAQILRDAAAALLAETATEEGAL